MTDKPTDDELIESLQQFADVLGETPSARQVYEDDDHTFRRGLYQDRFGSWNDALRAAGLPVNREQRVTKEELREELLAFADEIGRVPRQCDLNAAENRPSVSTYHRRFGSWNAALRACDLEANARWNYSREELIADLQRVAEELGRPPKYDEITARDDTASAAAYEQTFGTFNQSLKAADLERRNIKNLSKAQLLEKLKMVQEELGHTPRYNDLSDFPAAPSAYTYEQHFGTFSNALEKAGMKPHVEFQVSKYDLIRELRAVANNLGRTPQVKDFRERDDVYGVSTYHRYFGSWIEAIEAAGLEPIDRSGENHPRWKGGREGYEYYGAEWPRQREKALERDDYQCVDCGMSQAEHRSEYDTGLHVHHQRPIREYINSETLTRSEGNQLSNLVTLCHACHGKWESLPVQLDQSDCERS